MVGGEGPGKASKVRKHQTARTPYERPRPAAGPAGAAIEPFDAFDAPGSAEKASLLGSVFSVASTPLRVARHLVNKVRCCLCLLNTYSALLGNILVFT